MAKTPAKKRSRGSALALVPALVHEQAQRTPSADLTRPDPPPSVRETITAFERLIGGREKLLEALSTCSDDPLVETVLVAIGHPDYDGDRSYSLATICRDAHITPWQLFTAFERAATARGQLLSKLEAANASPTVTRQVIADALPHQIPCTACNGEGRTTPDPTKAAVAPAPPPPAGHPSNLVRQKTIRVPGAPPRPLKPGEQPAVAVPESSKPRNQQMR